MSRNESDTAEIIPFLVFARRGTSEQKMVELCLQDSEQGDLIIRKITPKHARHLGMRLLEAAEIGE